MIRTAIALENGLVCELNESLQTAAIISSPNVIGAIIVPKYIEFDSKKFYITAIKGFAFHRNRTIESLSFAEGSSLQRICKNAFIDSSLASLSIPESLEELDEQWSFGASSLVKITVDPRNKRFICIDDTFLLKKDKSDNYDTLLYVRRDVKGEITIPKGVRVIAESSFSRCHNLLSVLFENSELEVINELSFNDCENIQKIAPIPKSVKNVGNESFEGLESLKTLEFLSSEINFGFLCFWGSSSLFCISLPNARNVKINKYSLNGVDEEFSLFLNCGAQINDR